MGSIQRIGGVGVDGVRAELFLEHGLPGVELEDGEHRGVRRGRGRLAGRRSSRSPPGRCWRVSRLACCGGVAEIGDGELVFGVVERGEVDGLGEVGVDVLPLGDEFFVDGVELVGLVGDELCGMSLSQYHWMTAASRSEVGVSALYSRSLGALPDCASGPCDVEAAVEGGRLVVPGPLDGVDGDGGDVEFGVTLLVDDVLGGGEAHLLERVAGGFEGVDFGGGELVGGGLVPVGAVHLGDVGGVEGEADGLDFLLPVVARGEGDALH